MGRFVELKKLSETKILIVNVTWHNVFFKINSQPGFISGDPYHGLILPRSKTKINIGSLTGSTEVVLQVTSAIYPCTVLLLPDFHTFWSLIDDEAIDKEFFDLKHRITVDDLSRNSVLQDTQDVLDYTLQSQQKAPDLVEKLDELESSLETKLFMIGAATVFLAIVLLWQIVFCFE